MLRGQAPVCHGVEMSGDCLDISPMHTCFHVAYDKDCDGMDGIPDVQDLARQSHQSWCCGG